MTKVKKPAAKAAQAAGKVLAGLKKLYSDAECELNFKNPYELLLSVILSAQCTDKRVNQVAPALFKRFPDFKAMAQADILELEKLIHSTGFYRSKARSILETSRAIMERFGGEVPRRMEDLLTLRGVARKTANVILGTAYGISSGIVVDTHMKRVSYRLGLTNQKDPVKVERDLVELIPQKDWIYFGHGMIWHGRRLCHARSPRCGECPFRTFCPQRGV